MKNVSGSTVNETKMIKAIQKIIGAKVDGSIGAQTMSDIAVKLGADCFPLSITIYDNPCIIAKDLVPASVKAPLSKFANAISGSFNNGSAPCSILVADGKAIHEVSCHYWDGTKPESVLYRLNNGAFGAKRVTSVQELPSGVKWAIGGMGLLDLYNPNAEGFTGKFSDVLRRTAHALVGVKNNMVYLCYVANMSGTQVNDYAKKLGLEHAIMLDGGHLAAINSEDKKINTAQRQLYIVQAR